MKLARECHLFADSFVCYFRVDLQDHECLGVANMFKNLVMMFPSVCITSLHTELYDKFIVNLQKLTCAFGREAALEEEVPHTF